MQEQEYLHVDDTTSPRAIGIESDCASRDPGNGVDGDSEQVGGSGAVPDL